MEDWIITSGRAKGIGDLLRLVRRAVHNPASEEGSAYVDQTYRIEVHVEGDFTLLVIAVELG